MTRSALLLSVPGNESIPKSGPMFDEWDPEEEASLCKYLSYWHRDLFQKCRFYVED